ncbi:MAG: tetratricopeptide repeat protein [Gemmatimonadota bacterium]|jgi:tetratricopeptide (TPR) repeat protein
MMNLSPPLRLPLPAVAAAVAVAVAIPVRTSPQTLPNALGQLRSGDYEEALSSLRGIARGPESSPRVLRYYARALMEVGRYDEAREVVAGPDGQATSLELENVLGEVLLTEGDLMGAEAAFRRAVEGGSRDREVARKNLGVLLWNRGDREAALALFDSFIDLYNRSSGNLTSEELMAVGISVRYLGVTNPALFQDALMAFDDAAAADPGDFGPELLIAELFLEKYRATDARDALREVLEVNPRHPRALLDQARILDFEGAGGALATTLQALEVNPRYADARAFLAGLYLKTWEYEQAVEEARTALETNPSHLGALSVLAAAHFLRGDSVGLREVRDRIHSLNPAYPDLYTVMAEHAAAHHRYAAAVELAHQAVSLDSTSWRAHGVLGVNQLRTGEMEAGRASLERAFAGDPYNPWYKNTLDLLDTFVHFRRFETEHFEIFLNEKEAELLAPYAMEAAEEAYAGLRRRYGIDPPTPIRLEIFPSHSDFSVRTLGIPGLGALGVSFGSVLVMDSPSARDSGEFNWASTLWHEVAHAFHLAMTAHQVPRWFTEGLAVHEQRIARADWGLKVSPAWLQAFESGRLQPVSRLNEGFVRPEYPEQVVFSYYEASLVLDLIESRHGLDALLAMMEGYREGKTDSQVFQEVLGESPEGFDETFQDYVRTRWGQRMAAVALPAEGHGELGALLAPTADVDALRVKVGELPGNFLLRLALGKALFREERFDEAEEELREALRLFPEYGGADSPYLYLAHIHRARGELDRAAQALQQLGGLNESLHPVDAEEAELRIELGEKAEAARALEKVVEIAPFQVEPHGILAQLSEDLQDYEGAVRERRALLALDPVDKADAHYRLALALAEAGELPEARSEVLKALELAPTFEEALELLLDLRERIG